MKNPMTNNKDELHPQDKRNLIIFVLVSVVIWFIFDQMILQPRMDAMHVAQEKAQEQVKAQAEKLGIDPATMNVARPRAVVLAETARLTLGNDAISGSLNLKGGRIDDVVLNHHFDTLEKKQRVALFSPAGTADPEYADFGWLSKDSNVRTPDKNSVWRVQGNSNLTPETPVTLYWDNGQGLRFTRMISLDDQFMFNIKRRVVNKTDRAVTLFPYSLVSQHGMPSDFFNRWIVHEGPIAYLKDELREYSYKKMLKEKEVSFRADRGWTGLSDHYWMTALVPQDGQDMKYKFTYTENIDPDKIGKYQVDVTSDAQTIAAGGSYETTVDLYAGTKNLSVIEAYEKTHGITHFDLTVDFGIFYFITKPFYHVLMFFANIFGNFGVAIICLTIVVRAAVFPLANTTFKSFAGMSKLAPEMQKLKAKYKDDKARLQKELVKLYEKEKVNPMAGCLPILVQIPIFFGIYKVLMISLEMRHAPFFGWIHDLSAPDPTTVFNLFGLIPWDPPGFMMFGAWSCLMLIFMIMQKKLSPPPADPMQQWMMYFFPYFISYILAKFAAGLVIYWTFSNGLSVLQQYIIMRRADADIYLFKSRAEKKQIKDDQKKKMHAPPKDETGDDEDVIEGERVDDDGESSDEAVSKPVSKPKPKKKKKKK